MTMTEDAREFMLEVCACDETLGDDGMCDCCRYHFEKIDEALGTWDVRKMIVGDEDDDHRIVQFMGHPLPNLDLEYADRLGTVVRCAVAAWASGSLATVRTARERELEDALIRMYKAWSALLPGIGALALDDYAIQNEAPLAARKALGNRAKELDDA